MLYEASILLASLVERRERRRAATEPAGCRTAAGPASARPGATEPSVQQIIDHVDRELQLMLFDLRGRGRRRTVQVIYVGLALLIGVGLVGFGVGGGFGGGGLLSSLTSNEGSSGASFPAQIKKYKKLTEQQPSDVNAWEQLTLARLHEAGGEAYCRRRQADEQGQRTVRADRAVVEQLPRAEPAEAERRTRAGDGAGVRRRRPQRARRSGQGAADRGRRQARQARRCTRRWPSTPTRPTTHASATSPPKRRSRSRRPRSASS